MYMYLIRKGLLWEGCFKYVLIFFFRKVKDLMIYLDRLKFYLL